MSETYLFVKMMKFDFNLDSKLKIEETFKELHTNDLGHEMKPQTVQILFAEFRKFLWLTCMEILF